jgi:hypothetical protein
MKRAAADLPARINDESDLRKYRTELPNIIDDLSLSVHAQRLYSHIKRRAGAGDGGECTAGLRGMARHCRMSLGKASQARKELLDRGLIRSRKETNRDGKFEVVTIVDIWPANFAFYDSLVRGTLVARGDEITRAADAFLASYLLSDGVHIVNTPPLGVHVVNEGVHTVNTGCSCGELKKEPSEERTPKEHTPRARARAHPSPVGMGGGKAALSRFDYEREILPWAKAQKAEDPNIKSAEALARARRRDGEDDDRIAAWLEEQKPEAVTRSLQQPPPRAQMGKRQAVRHIGSILDVNPQLDIAGELAQLDVSEETRAYVLSYDFPQRRAATPTQACAAATREPELTSEPARVRHLRPVTSGASVSP